MIVDCGGGTIDITVHQVSSHGGLDEVAAGTGGAYGSTYVDKEFLEYLKKQLDTQALADYQEKYPIGWLELMANWERKKCNFKPTTTTTTYFDIPSPLYKILSKDYPEVLEQLAEEQDEDDEKVYIDSETMQAFFKPVLDGLVKTIEEQFQILAGHQCDILYLVGGFSTSPVLRQRIQQEFKDRIKIVMPAQPGAAIVEGAAAFGMNPESIRSRRSRLTYGCDIRAVFDEKLDLARKSDRKYDDEKREYYMNNRFYSFITAGQSVGIDEVITNSFSPPTAATTVVTFTFYATKKEKLRYIDEPGVQKIGEIKVDISSTVGTENRSIEASMNFGKTEIAITVKEVKTGKEYKTNLQFSSSYSIESSWQESAPTDVPLLDFDDIDKIPW
jgi:molecular chaperone DnaK (HSP70)